MPEAHREERQGEELSLGDVEALRLGAADYFSALKEAAKLLAARHRIVRQHLLEEQGAFDGLLRTGQAHRRRASVLKGNDGALLGLRLGFQILERVAYVVGMVAIADELDEPSDALLRARETLPPLLQLGVGRPRQAPEHLGHSLADEVHLLGPRELLTQETEQAPAHYVFTQ